MSNAAAVEVFDPGAPPPVALVQAPVGGGIVRAVGSVAEMVEAATEYQELCHALLDATDYQAVGDKSFKKKSAWRKLNVAFGVSTELVAEEYQEDDGGHITRAKITVRAIAPNGRHTDGIGLCDVNERCCTPSTCRLRTHWEDSGKATGHTHCTDDCDGRHAFSKPDHDIPATAYTRAANRASSDLYGLGEVSAEEIGANDWNARADAAEQAAATKAPGRRSGSSTTSKRPAPTSAAPRTQEEAQAAVMDRYEDRQPTETVNGERIPAEPPLVTARTHHGRNGSSSTGPRDQTLDRRRKQVYAMCMDAGVDVTDTILLGIGRAGVTHTNQLDLDECQRVILFLRSGVSQAHPA